MDLQKQFEKERGQKEPTAEHKFTCKTFLPDGKTTSATRCQFCGKEKWEHFMEKSNHTETPKM